MGLVIIYLTAIVAANLLVATFGPAISVMNAFLFIGLDLTCRDRLHEQWHGRYLWWKMALLIGAGSLLSWLLNASAGPIALASLVAFAASGTADALCYHLLRERAYLVKVNGSNIVSAGVDSVIFPALAFGWPLVWLVVIGQFIAKVAGGAIWSVLLHGRVQRAIAVTQVQP